jgi:PAS domain S-box-containing protein
MGVGGDSVLTWQLEPLTGGLLGVILILTGLLGGGILRRHSQLVRARAEKTELMRQQEEIERLSRLYATLSQVNQAIVRVVSREGLFQEVCRVAVASGHFKLAWIGEHRAETHQLVPVASAGDQAEYLKSGQAFAHNGPEGQSPVGASFRKGRTEVSNDLLADVRMTPWHEAMRRHGLAASAAVPIHFGGQPWGILALYSGSTHFFHEREIKLLEEMALDISFALDHLGNTEALRASEEKFRAYAEHLADAFIVHDGEGQLVEVNQEACRSLGYTREELGRLTLDEIEVGHNPARASATWKAMRPGEILTFEARHRQKDGKIFPVEVRLGSFVHQGQAYCLRLARDITERKRADESLRLLSHAIEQTTTSVQITDLNGQIEYANRQFCQTNGRAIGVGGGGSPRILKSEETAGVVCQQLWQAIKQGTEWEGDLLTRREDGQPFWEHVIISPVKDEAGRATHFIAIRQDVTVQKINQEKLREQARLIDEAYEAIILYDLEGTIGLWNQGAERTFGWQRSEALGRNLNDLLHYDVGKYRTAWAEVLADDCWTGEFASCTKEGKAITVDWHWTLLRDEAGQPQKVLIFGHDITAQKQIEGQLLRAQRQQTIGALSSGVAHDLNNILAPFLAGLPLLQEEITNPETRELVTMMEASARRGADIVKQLLLFSRGGESQRIPVRLDHTVREVKRIIRETFPKDVVVETNWPEDLWPVLADPTQIYQVLLNLCVNARDAMPGGGTLMIGLSNAQMTAEDVVSHPRAKAGPYVVLSVRDTGCGMTAAVRERIFEPFYTTKEVGKGTGLGLSVVFSVVERHGGFIKVQSEVGKGTEFCVGLPALSEPANGQAAHRVQKSPAGGGEMVLLVDDEEAIRGVLRQVLERRGYRVAAVPCGAEALAAFAEQVNAIEVVVTDYSMPGMNGLQLMKMLHERNPRLPIIIVTGVDQNLGLEDSPMANVVQVLKKPFSSDALLKAVAKALRRRVVSQD